MVISDVLKQLGKIYNAHGDLEVTMYIDEEDDIVEINQEDTIIFEEMFVVFMPSDNSILLYGDNKKPTGLRG